MHTQLGLRAALHRYDGLVRRLHQSLTRAMAAARAQSDVRKSFAMTCWHVVDTPIWCMPPTVEAFQTPHTWQPWPSKLVASLRCGLTSYAICTGVPHFPLSFISPFFLRHVFSRSLIRMLSGSPPRCTTVACTQGHTEFGIIILVSHRGQQYNTLVTYIYLALRWECSAAYEPLNLERKQHSTRQALPNDQ